MQEASDALTLSRNLADSNGAPGSWFDWTLDRILMKEAAASILKQAPSPWNTLSLTERQGLPRPPVETREIIAKSGGTGQLEPHDGG